MALIEKARWSLLSALAIAALASCGPATREPEPPAEPEAPYRPATAPDLSPPKGGEPVGAMPSLVVSGEVAPFHPAPPGAGTKKKRATAAPLPSHAVAGKSAVYAPRGGQDEAGYPAPSAEGGEAGKAPPASRER